MDARQLQWALNNRRRRTRTVRLIEAVDDLPMKRWVRHAQRHRVLIQVLEEQLGPESMRRLTVGGIRRGVLTLELEDAGEAYLYQVNHSLQLLEAIRTEMPGAGVIDVRFRQCRDQER